MKLEISLFSLMIIFKNVYVFVKISLPVRSLGDK
jgi:hypothetical protein